MREGSFFEPLRGERFDLIATNPPFVISPATGERLVYRDSGLPGDRVVEDIVRQAPDLLADGGWCQVLGNWVIERGRPWDERLATWLDADCDALVVQREVVDPSEYVELWLKDAGLHGGDDYVRRYDTWLSWFDEQGIEGVGFGWLNLRRTGGGRHQLLDWPYDVEQPIGPAIAEWGAAVGAEVDGGRPPRGASRPAPGDAGQPRRRGPRDDRAAPAAGAAPGPRRSTPSRRPSWGPATVTWRSGRSSARWRSCWSWTPTTYAATLLPVVDELVAEGFLVRDR